MSRGGKKQYRPLCLTGKGLRGRNRPGADSRPLLTPSRRMPSKPHSLGLALTAFTAGQAAPSPGSGKLLSSLDPLSGRLQFWVSDVLSKIVTSAALFLVHLEIA